MIIQDTIIAISKIQKVNRGNCCNSNYIEIIHDNNSRTSFDYGFDVEKRDTDYNKLAKALSEQ